MGKIKSKLARRTADTLLKEKINFSESFGKNKKILGSTMPSKKMRNQLAGLLSRLKRQEKENQIKIEKSIEASKK